MSNNFIFETKYNNTKKLILTAILTTSISALALRQTNRGRIQAQNSNPVVKQSQSWASNSVPTKTEGITMLDTVWNPLTATQQKDRLKAYTDAKAFINNSSTGGTCVSTTLKKTFQDPQRKDSSARIDIEIITGCAFKN